MNQKSTNFNKEEVISPTSKIQEPEDINENRITNKINLLSSDNINHFINKLSSPGFLGSIHLKDNVSQKNSLINSVLNKDLENKLSKSLRNPLSNPLTRFLLFAMILFNILWIIFIYIL